MSFTYLYYMIHMFVRLQFNCVFLEKYDLNVLVRGYPTSECSLILRKKNLMSLYNGLI